MDVLMMVIGIVVIPSLCGWLVWIIGNTISKKRKLKEAQKKQEYARRHEEGYAKLWDHRAQKYIYQCYCAFGLSWREEDKGPKSFFHAMQQYTSYKPIYSIDGVIIGYNVTVTEEGLQMLKNYGAE